MLAVSRDALYAWTAERLVRSQTAKGHDSYYYLFDHAYPATAEKGLNAFHAAEIPYVFGTMNRTPSYWPKAPDTETERALSAAMTDYWASFAKTGKPLAKGQPDWPAYGREEAYMAFIDAPQPGQRLMPGMFTLHETAMCRRRAAGTMQWNWNAGLISPVLPPKGKDC